MILAFHKSLYGILSNLDDKEAFNVKLYENIDPDTSKDIISGTHCPNRAMHKIIT